MTVKKAKGKQTKKKTIGVNRRQFMTGVGAATGAAAISTVFVRPAMAAKFPNQPIKLQVPFKPGGGTDRSARLFAPFLAKALGVPVKVVNVGGAGGWVSWAQVYKWDPVKDDHMLAYVNVPHVFKMHDPRNKRTEKIENFNFVSGHSLDPCIWAIREGDKRFSDLKGFIDYAVKNPNKIVMSTTAVGSDDHQGIAFAEKFINGFKVRKVYANSDAKKLREVIGGHTDAVGGNVGYYIPYMLEGKIKAIAVLDTQRSPFLPTVPTFEEVTGVKNVSFAGRIFAVARGLPKEKYDVYANAIKKAMDDPNYALKELRNGNGLWPLKGEELKKQINAASDNVLKVKYWEVEGN